MTVAFHRIAQSDSASAVVCGATEWHLANGTTIKFGQTVYGAADERPYAPAPNEDRYEALIKGFQWFKFTYHGKQPQLVYFVVDITDRDVPLDVDVFTPGLDSNGQPGIVPYANGSFVYQ